MFDKKHIISAFYSFNDVSNSLTMSFFVVFVFLRILSKKVKKAASFCIQMQKFMIFKDFLLKCANSNWQSCLGIKMSLDNKRIPQNSGQKQGFSTHFSIVFPVTFPLFSKA